MQKQRTKTFNSTIQCRCIHKKETPRRNSWQQICMGTGGTYRRLRAKKATPASAATAKSAPPNNNQVPVLASSSASSSSSSPSLSEVVAGTALAAENVRSLQGQHAKHACSRSQNYNESHYRRQPQIPFVVPLCSLAHARTRRPGLPLA